MHPSIIASSPSPLAIRRLKTSMYVNSSPFFRFVPFFTPPPPRARSRSPIGEKRKTQHENRETPPGDRPKLTHGRQKISASDCLPIDTIESKRSQTTTRIPTPPRHARMPPCAAVVEWITEPGVAIGRRSTPRDAAHSRAESTPHTLSRTRCTPLERSRRSSRTRRLSSRTRRHRHVTDDGRR